MISPIQLLISPIQWASFISQTSLTSFIHSLVPTNARFPLLCSELRFATVQVLRGIGGFWATFRPVRLSYDSCTTPGRISTVKVGCCCVCTTVGLQLRTVLLQYSCGAGGKAEIAEKPKMSSYTSGTRTDNTSAHSQTRYQLSHPGSPKTLTWQPHINYISNTISTGLGIITKLNWWFNTSQHCWFYTMPSYTHDT